MIHFHNLTVKKVVRETDDCVSVTFSVPDNLQEIFRFKPGQSLTFRKSLAGEEVRRSYSICSAPADGVLRVAIKKVEGGLFSTWANEALKPGDVLEVMPPVGSFGTELHPENKKAYVAFAAGSGITPVLSIIKSALQTEPHSTFTLVYGNRTKGSIIFKEALEALKDQFIDRFRLIHILSRERSETDINSGRIDVPKLESLFQKLIDAQKVDDYFLCGPEEMIFCIKGFLEARGITKDHIHFELFTIPGQKASVVKTEDKEVSNAGPRAQVGVKLDGIMFDFELPFSGQSILDAALAQGADLPYACKGGVCCTCKARLTEGQVQMEVAWGLEQDEIDKGFILTCQSHPVTEKVVVDFDVK
jgi:ring-1,2-phenylacetyl-CoA epoxidase subunit PaaE